MNKTIESIQLNFNESNLLLLNLALSVIMFGVALDLKKENFTQIGQNPKGLLTGVASQFILLPAITFILLWLTNPVPGLAMGMILVAACPGGNVSNFFSKVGKGNIELSVSLTIVASLAAVVMTPFNFKFWSGLLGLESLVNLTIDFYGIMQTIAVIIIIPLVSGFIVANKFPKTSTAIGRPLRVISFMVLIAIIGLAFGANFELFINYYHYVIYLVFVHNALAILVGYYFSKATGNSRRDQITIAIETGIQNSGLGLVIIFTFFNGNGGMAIITAWWGIWHIISGTLIAHWFAYVDSKNLKMITLE